MKMTYILSLVMVSSSVIGTNYAQSGGFMPAGSGQIVDVLTNHPDQLIDLIEYIKKDRNSPLAQSVTAAATIWILEENKQNFCTNCLRKCPPSEKPGLNQCKLSCDIVADKMGGSACQKHMR